MKTLRLMLATTLLGAVAVACDDDEGPVDNSIGEVGREETLNAGPEDVPETPGGLSGDPVAAVEGRIQAQFGDREWADDISISVADSTVVGELESGDEAAVDEACTAIAGLLVADGAGLDAYGARVEGADGVTFEAEAGDPQCARSS